MPPVRRLTAILAADLAGTPAIEGAKASLADLQKTTPEINSIAASYVYAPFLTYPSRRRPNMKP